MCNSYIITIEEECTICLEFMNDTNEHILNCKHVFHINCIESWIKYSKKNMPNM